MGSHGFRLFLGEGDAEAADTAVTDLDTRSLRHRFPQIQASERVGDETDSLVQKGQRTRVHPRSRGAQTAAVEHRDAHPRFRQVESSG